MMVMPTIYKSKTSRHSIPSLEFSHQSPTFLRFTNLKHSSQVPFPSCLNFPYCKMTESVLKQHTTSLYFLIITITLGFIYILISSHFDVTSQRRLCGQFENIFWYITVECRCTNQTKQKHKNIVLFRQIQNYLCLTKWLIVYQDNVAYP